MIKIIVLNGCVSFYFFYLAANTLYYICLNDDVFSSTLSLSGSRMKGLFNFNVLV